ATKPTSSDTVIRSQACSERSLRNFRTIQKTLAVSCGCFLVKWEKKGKKTPVKMGSTTKRKPGGIPRTQGEKKRMIHRPNQKLPAWYAHRRCYGRPWPHAPLLALLPPQQSNLRRHRTCPFGHSCKATSFACWIG